MFVNSLYFLVLSMLSFWKAVKLVSYLSLSDRTRFWILLSLSFKLYYCALFTISRSLRTLKLNRSFSLFSLKMAFMSSIHFSRVCISFSSFIFYSWFVFASVLRKISIFSAYSFCFCIFSYENCFSVSLCFWNKVSISSKLCLSSSARSLSNSSSIDRSWVPKSWRKWLN
jgi:hypothetical protein